jgi:tetratricopeptide (TPR) repeat protein
LCCGSRERTHFWAYQRIAGELLKLGLRVSPRTVRRILLTAGSGRAAASGPELAAIPAPAGGQNMLACNFFTAEQKWRESCDIFLAIGERSFLSTRAADLAERAPYALGKYDEAERYAELGRETGSSDDIETQARWRGARAKVLARRGESGAAEGLAREAVELAENTDFLELRGDVLTDAAEVFRLAGRLDEAARFAQQALETYRTKASSTRPARSRHSLSDCMPACRSCDQKLDGIVTGPASDRAFRADWDGTVMEQRGRNRWQRFGLPEARKSLARTANRCQRLPPVAVLIAW